MHELMARRGVPDDSFTQSELEKFYSKGALNASLLELYCYPHKLRTYIVELELDLANLNPSYAMFMRRCRFILNQTNLTTVIKDKMCKRLEEIWMTTMT